MQVPYNFQQVINNNQYQVISGVKCFPVSMLDENFSYLCKVVNVGSTAPTISYDGQFWFDGTTLKIAQSSSWKDIKVANAVNADKLGGLLPSQFLRSDQNTVCSGGITAQQFTSTTTSAPPLVVSSNQLVTNLCADYVDGYHVDSTGALTGQLVQFDTTNVKLKPAPIYVASGKVGVGITSPKASLHVIGEESVWFGIGSNTYPTTPSSGAGALVGKSGTSDFRLTLQDGSGRVNMYWNAYYDSSAAAHKYIVSNESACRFSESVNGTTGCFFGIFGAPAGTAGDTITWTQVAEFASGVDVWLSPRGVSSDFFISSSGNVGIGTTSPKTNLHVNSSGSTIVRVDAPSSQQCGVQWAKDNSAKWSAYIDVNSSNLRFWDGADVRVTFANGGNVGIGTVTPAYNLDVNGNIRCSTLYYTTLSQSSDANIKIDIQSISDYLNTDCLDIISCLKPVKYVYIDDPSKTNRFGFIAQDVSEVCPELVTTDADGKVCLNYVDLIAILTRGIQELYDMLGKVVQKIGGIE